MSKERRWKSPARTHFQQKGGRPSVGSIFRAVDEMELAFIDFETIPLIRLVEDMVNKAKLLGVSSDAQKRLNKALNIIKAERRR